MSNRVKDIDIKVIQEYSYLLYWICGDQRYFEWIF